MKSDYTIKKATCDELRTVVDWAAAEGWNPGVNDADCFHPADPEGFLIGELNGEPVASISAVKYGGTFGFIGFYIVKPEHRGKGFGLRIWQEGMKYLEGLNVGLDGVIAQQENYKKSGFSLACRNIRYEGITGGYPSDNSNIIRLSDFPFELIDSYDRPFFPASRSGFLKRWLRQPDGHALGILQNGKIVGYGVIRKCRKGYKIGPLFADNPELADSLFLALQASVTPSKPFFLDLPEENQHAKALAGRYQMKTVFETARMYTQAHPYLPMDRIFGITSFELG